MRFRLPVRRPVRTALTVLAAAVTLSVAAGVGYAAIPGADGTITSCYDSQGYVRIVDAAAACPTGSTRLAFNQRGPGFQYKGGYSVSTDQADGYQVGDVAHCGWFGEAQQMSSGAYVKVVRKPAVDRASVGWCTAANGWQMMVGDGKTGPQGPAGPSNVFRARVNATGTVVLNKGLTQVATSGIGAYLRLPDGVDARTCTVAASSWDATVAASRWDTTDPSWVYVLTFRNGQYVRAGLDITVTC